MKRTLLCSILVFASAVASADTIEMKVYGLVCAFCAQGIEKTLRKNPATEDVVVSLEHQLVAVATQIIVDLRFWPDVLMPQAQGVPQFMLHRVVIARGEQVQVHLVDVLGAHIDQVFPAAQIQVNRRRRPEVDSD